MLPTRQFWLVQWNNSAVHYTSYAVCIEFGIFGKHFKDINHKKITNFNRNNSVAWWFHEAWLIKNHSSVINFAIHICNVPTKFKRNSLFLFRKSIDFPSHAQLVIYIYHRVLNLCSGAITSSSNSSNSTTIRNNTFSTFNILSSLAQLSK